MYKLLSLLLILCLIASSCGKAAKETPKNPDEVTLTNFMQKLVDDKEFYTYFVGAPSKTAISSSKIKEFSKVRKDVDKAIERLTKERKIDPRELSNLIAKKYVPDYSNVTDRMKKDASERGTFYAKVDSSKTNLKNIFNEFHAFIADKKDHKVPSKTELLKILGAKGKTLFKCPASKKEYEVLGAGKKFTFDAKTSFIKVRLNNGSEIILYQDGKAEQVK